MSHLRLLLNAEGYDYSDDMLSAGLHLVLHGPGEHPRLIGHDNNIVLTAGTQNFITGRVRYLLALFIYATSLRACLDLIPPVLTVVIAFLFPITNILGDAVALRVERRTNDQEVAGSTPARALLA